MFVYYSGSQVIWRNIAHNFVVMILKSGQIFGHEACVCELCKLRKITLGNCYDQNQVRFLKSFLSFSLKHVFLVLAL